MAQVESVAAADVDHYLRTVPGDEGSAPRRVRPFFSVGVDRLTRANVPVVGVSRLGHHSPPGYRVILVYRVSPVCYLGIVVHWIPPVARAALTT